MTRKNSTCCKWQNLTQRHVHVHESILHTKTETHKSVGRRKCRSGGMGGRYRNVILTVTLIFSDTRKNARQPMHTCTHGIHTHRRGAIAISCLQTGAIFSLSLSPLLAQPLRRCGDKISIPFAPLLPSTAEQEVKTKGTEGEEERGEETGRTMLTKEDIGRRELRLQWGQRHIALRV